MHLSKKVACVALCVAQTTYAFPGITRRATTQAATPSTIDIPLLFDSNGRYVMTVNMSPGANQQEFNLTFATSTGLTSVAGVGCSSCSGISLYNQSASTTAKALNGNESVSLVGGTYSGSVIKEDCTVDTTGSPWAYKNQTIVIAGEQQNGTVFGNGASGLVGLGTNRLPVQSGSGYTPTFSDSIFSRWLNNHTDQDSFRFGMDILPPVVTPTNASSPTSASPASSSAGTLHWLAPDMARYDQGALTYKTVQSNASLVYSSGSQPDWLVPLDGWTVASAGESFASADEMMVSVDPYYTDIYFPAREAQLFNAVISGSTLQSGLSTLGAQAQAWEVPCDARVSLTININAQTFTVDESVLVRQTTSGACFSGVEGWTDAAVEEYLFGALFVSQIYLVFNIGRNGTDSVGFAPKTALKKSTTVGAIAGGTVGGVVGLVLVGLAAFFYVRSRRDRAHLRDTVAAFEEHKVASTIQPFPLGARLLYEEDVAPPAYEVGAAGGASPATVVTGGPVRASKGGYAGSASEGALSADVEPSEAPSGSSRPLRVESKGMYIVHE